MDHGLDKDTLDTTTTHTLLDREPLYVYHMAAQTHHCILRLLRLEACMCSGPKHASQASLDLGFLIVLVDPII